MRCPDDALLQMFTEAELDPGATEAIQKHLSTCGPCRTAVARYKQLLWDLEHPQEVPLPLEIGAMQARLMEAWAREQKAHQHPMSRRLVPAWAGYTLLWTRHVPAVDLVGRFLFQTGRRVITSRLPLVGRWFQRR